jgi:hypothetical protein
VFVAEDIAAMTDDECIAYAMLLGAKYSVWSAAGWHCCSGAGGLLCYATTQVGAARQFLEAHSRA